MLFGQSIPQNYTYTSKATEFGRGDKTKMGSLNEWTPGVGTYEVKTQFEKKTETQEVVKEDGAS
jgi:hypothetical protein